MRLTIDHVTTYRFSKPQARLVQWLRMTPSDHDGQAVIAWRIDVDCDVRLKAGRDGFGNATHMLYADGPLDAIELTVRGEVLTEEREGAVAGAAEPLPPLLFARPTALTAADDALTDFARSEARGGKPLDQLAALNGAIGGRIARIAGVADPQRSAADAFAAGKGIPRDLAHIFIATARALGIPARYVSGHCLECTAGQPHRTAHAWTEAWDDAAGWTAFDPSFGTRTDERYVRVAAGLDASFATPVSGARRGGGQEMLDVRVDVAQS